MLESNLESIAGRLARLSTRRKPLLGHRRNGGISYPMVRSVWAPVTVANGLIIAGLFAVSCGTTFAETASELQRSPQYQENERAIAILDNVPAAIHSCVWEGTFRHTWTVEGVKSRIAECQLIRYTYLSRQLIKNGLPILVIIVSSALAFGFRRRIAAGVYTLFVGILRIGIRIKRFLDRAVKEAAGSVEKNPPG